MTPADLASLSNAVAADSDATKPRNGEWHALRRAASEAAKALSYALKEAARRGTTVDESRYVVGVHPQAALRLVLDMRRVTEALEGARRVLASIEWGPSHRVGCGCCDDGKAPDTCPACGVDSPLDWNKAGTLGTYRWGDRDTGHAPDCALAAALGVAG